jgi:outer membrane usher protein
MLRTARHALGALWILGAVGVSGAAPAGTVRDIWVEVRINNVPQPEFALLHVDLRGHLFVRLADMRAWHMRALRSAEAADIVRIDDVPGLRVHLEEDELVLRLEAEPGLFAAQTLSNDRRNDAPQRGIPAVFMEYNLFAQRNGGTGAGETYSALVQMGSSLGRASFTSSWLGSRFAGGTAAAAADPGHSSWHRLDTDLLLDFPEYTARLMLGDSVTSPGTLGQSVRFTGIHWATDYATRPGLTPYALPVISGTATVPSSIELYVNQSLVQRTTVDAGPFQLNNVPIPVGQGAVDIRMRDILGNVQQLAVPYLVIPQLIAPGLTTVDFSAGAVREDYGISNFAYGRAFISGGIQHGLNDVATLNGSAEVAPGSSEVTARGGAALRAGRNMTLELTPAVSHAGLLGSGGAVDAGIDALWNVAAFGVHFRSASPRFVELGDQVPGGRLRTEWATQASVQFGPCGSLGALYAWRRSYVMPTTSAATLTYNLSLRRLGAVGVFVSNTRSSGVSDVVAGVTFTHYFEKGVTVAMTDTANDGASAFTVQVGRAPPPDAGWGWELAHARGGVDTDGARIDARSPYGNGSGEIDSARSGTIGILAWQGGFLWAGGRAWPAQTLTGPAALVEVPDLGGVEVLHDGQPVGRTDAAGRILVPALRPFEDNNITVVPEDLPLTAMVDSDRLIIRPYSHGVVRGVLAVSAGESRVFVLRLGARDFVPAGAGVVIDGHTYPVGTQGLAQLPVRRESQDGVVSWLDHGTSGPGRRCGVRLPASLAIGAGVADPLALECKVLP